MKHAVRRRLYRLTSKGRIDFFRALDSRASAAFYKTISDRLLGAYNPIYIR